MSNRYAQSLADAIGPHLPRDVTVKAVDNLQNHIIWQHAEGASGLIDLYHVDRSPVDNRRTPTDSDRERLMELIRADARDQASDPRFTPAARQAANAANDALTV